MEKTAKFTNVGFAGLFLNKNQTINSRLENGCVGADDGGIYCLLSQSSKEITFDWTLKNG